MTDPIRTPHLPAAEVAAPCAVPADAEAPLQPAASQWLDDAELRAVAGDPAIRNESL